MAPELARGDAHIDGRVDVFRPRNILFEILTLKQLLHGKTAQDVADNLLGQALLKPSEAAPDRSIPATLEAICCRALEKDPRERYPSVQSLLDALKAYHPRRGFTRPGDQALGQPDWPPQGKSG